MKRNISKTELIVATVIAVILVIDSRDLLFFFSVMGFSLFCNGVVIRNLRAG